MTDCSCTNFPASPTAPLRLAGLMVESSTALASFGALQWRWQQQVRSGPARGQLGNMG